MAWNVLLDCTALVVETRQACMHSMSQALDYGVEYKLHCFAGTYTQAQASMRAATTPR